ncbi:MAG: hypothetical protein U0L49_01445 [Eubacterium sp.]|nr:hypothetical protein [Eubacterium sp.]
MNKKISKILVTAATVALTSGMMGMPVMAESTYRNNTTDNREFSFNKYLVMSKDASVPNATFNFKLGDTYDEEVTEITNTLFDGRDATPIEPVRYREYKLYFRNKNSGETEGDDTELPVGAKPGNFSAGWDDDSTLDDSYAVKASAPVKTPADTAGDNTGDAGTSSAIGILDPIDAGVVGHPTFDQGTEDAKNKVSCTFTERDSTTNEDDGSVPGDIKFKTSDDKTDEKYAVNALKISFADVTFPEPGAYRYYIEEDATTDLQGIETDTDQLRVLDVYVINDPANPGKLKIADYILHKDAKSTPDANGKLSDKSTGFTNQYYSQNLSFAKKVEGNQGSKDQYFAFTVKLTPHQGKSINDKDTFTVDMSHASTFSDVTDTEKLKAKPNAATSYTIETIKNANNITSLTGEQMKAGYTFYLQNGQYITINGVSVGTTYNVTEAEAAGYTSTAASADQAIELGTEDAKNTFADAADGTITTKDIRTGFTNTKQGTIPTGILLTIAPYAIALIGAAVVVICVAVHMSRRKNEEA